MGGGGTADIGPGGVGKGGEDADSTAWENGREDKENARTKRSGKQSKFFLLIMFSRFSYFRRRFKHQCHKVYLLARTIGTILMEKRREYEKFVHTSFRIPLRVRIELEDEAKRLGTNLNALGNNVLARHATFDQLTEHVEAVTLARAIFTSMLEKISEEDMADAGRELGSRIAKQTLAFYNIQPSLENLTDSFFRPLGSFSRWYSFNTSGSGQSLKMVFEHAYGPKWTAFLKEYLSGVIKSTTGVEPRIKTEDNLLTIRF